MIYDLSKPIDLKKYNAYSNKLIEDKATVDLTKKRKKRSLKQNDYLHVVITLFAIEYGESVCAMKQILKHWYGLFEEKAGAIVYGKTSKMDSKELSTFIEWIRNKASKDLGLYIPTSEEYLENQAELNRMMYQNKEYL